jgi:Domain of unknown function (DUF4383)
VSDNKSLAQLLMPFFGAGYVAIGIIGWCITGFDNFVQNTGDKLIGFHINPMHNLVHFTIGAFLIIMSRQSKTTAEGACLGAALFYIVAFVIGTIGTSNLTIISMTGHGDLENLNHIVNGVALLAIGLISSAATEAEAKRSGVPA